MCSLAHSLFGSLNCACSRSQLFVVCFVYFLLACFESQRKKLSWWADVLLRNKTKNTNQKIKICCTIIIIPNCNCAKIFKTKFNWIWFNENATAAAAPPPSTAIIIFKLNLSLDKSKHNKKPTRRKKKCGRKDAATAAADTDVENRVTKHRIEITVYAKFSCCGCSLNIKTK